MLLLDCGLTENSSGVPPCYSFQGKNVVLLGGFKEYSALSFFKGTLLQETNGVLSKPGENSQAVRLIRFTDLEEIMELKPILKNYIHEAIEEEKAGLKVNFPTSQPNQISLQL